MKLEGQQPQLNLDIMKDTKPIVCEAKQLDLEKGIEVICDGTAYDEATELRKVSALVSPNGKVGVIPVPFYFCLKCGARKDLAGIS
tara:strand:+ start:302 stop:559 length:258 start_codon:yes stop_codon:yes gene_type:complete